MKALTPQELTLAAEFPAASREQWEKLVVGVLDKSGARGLLPAAAAEQLNVTVGGIRIAGIYGPDDVAAAGVPDAGFPGAAPFVRGGVPRGPSAAGTCGRCSTCPTRRLPASRS